MKKRNLGPILLILIFVIAFVGYRYYDVLHTDTEAPVITVDQSRQLQVSVEDPKNLLLQGVTASDAQDGDVTGKLVVESVRLVDKDGLIEVVYAVADKSGNVAKAARNVLYTDYDSPKFSLNGPLIYEDNVKFDIMSAVFAHDVLDGDIQHRIRATSLAEKDISNVGKHQVYFQVTNSIGDTAEIVMPVEVLKAGTYAAELTLTDYLVYIPAGENFQPKSYLNRFKYKSEDMNLRGILPDDLSVETAGSVDTDTPGVYTVEYEVTYTVRHETNPEFDQHFTGYSKLIVVVEG